MRKVPLMLGIAASLTMASCMVFAGGEDDDVNSYDTMGYYVYSTDDPNQMQQNDFSGMYVGVQAGVNINTIDYDITDAPDHLQSTITTSNTDAIAGGIVGWGLTWDEFYLGLEANGRYMFGGNGNGVFYQYGSTSGRIGEFDERWSTGLGLRLGGIVYNTAMIYGYGGGAYGSFKISASEGTNYESVTKNKFAYALGAGVDVQINRSFNLDMRYLFRRYGSIKFTDNNGVNLSAEPTDNLVMLAGTYHFAV